MANEEISYGYLFYLVTNIDYIVPFILELFSR